MINALSNALSGLIGAQKRLDISAENVANAGNAGTTSRREGPAAYRAQTALQTPLIDQNGTVIGTSVTSNDKKPATQSVFNPGSPFADEGGFIDVPNVDFVEEAININLAEISFAANAQVINAARDLSLATIGLIDRS